MSQEEAHLCQNLYVKMSCVLDEFHADHPYKMDHMISVIVKLLSNTTSIICSDNINITRNYLFRLINFELDNIEKKVNNENS